MIATVPDAGPTASVARAMSRYLRTSSADEEQHASNLELFYDLVFVLAVTQVSHLLLDDLTWGGAGKSLLVLLVIWWAWTYTTWVTNMLDPDAIVVRLLVLAIMFGSLVMAVAIPDAFGSRALLFAGAYVAIQVGRTAFLTFVVAGRGSPAACARTHILTWFLASGVFWIAGALASDSARITLWVIAIAIDYSAPLVFYRVPGRRRLSPDSWSVETSHFAERFQLFIIIALGESIVVTGATTSDLPLDGARFAAFALAFLSTAAFWWLYFSLVATIAQRRLALAQDSTKLARDGYTFLHVDHRRRHHRLRCRRRARDRPSTRHAADARARRARCRACHLSPRTRSLPPADGRLGQLEEIGRSDRLRLRRTRRSERPRPGGRCDCSSASSPP